MDDKTQIDKVMKKVEDQKKEISSERIVLVVETRWVVMIDGSNMERDHTMIPVKRFEKLNIRDRKLLEETIDVEKEYADDVNSLNNDSK